MTKLYGAALAEQIRAERQRILDAMKRREIRIANGETDEDDCFLSMRSEEQNLRKCDMQLSILDTDGLMEFDGVFDAEGKEVNVHPITNQWGKISYTGRGANSARLDVANDKLFLFSEVELTGATEYTTTGEGWQYEYFKDEENRIKERSDGSACSWWLRSPSVDSGNDFRYVGGFGGVYNYSASNACGVSFGFCV